MIMRKYFASKSNIVSAVNIIFAMVFTVSEFLYNFKKINISTTLFPVNFIILTVIDFEVTPKKLSSY